MPEKHMSDCTPNIADILEAVLAVKLRDEDGGTPTVYDALPDGLGKQALEMVKGEKERGAQYMYSVFCGSKETGALRRASMDLTRALAEMRRSRNA